MAKALWPNCPPLAQYLAKAMIESHATHEWLAYLAYRRFSASRPSDHPAQHVMREERDHFDQLAVAYPRSWGSLEAIAKKKAAALRVPVIRSDLEFFVASWIFDFAGLVQIEGLQNCRWPAYRKAARSILRDEREHKRDGFRRLSAYLKAKPSRVVAAEKLTKKWLTFSRSAFGGAGSPFDLLAVRYSLKERSSLEQLRRFERAILKDASAIFSEPLPKKRGSVPRRP